MRCAAYIISASLKRKEDVKHARTARKCKQAAKEIWINDILTQAVWDDKHRIEFNSCSVMILQLKGSQDYHRVHMIPKATNDNRT